MGQRGQPNVSLFVRGTIERLQLSSDQCIIVSVIYLSGVIPDLPLAPGIKRAIEPSSVGWFYFCSGQISGSPQYLCSRDGFSKNELTTILLPGYSAIVKTSLMSVPALSYLRK